MFLCQPVAIITIFWYNAAAFTPASPERQYAKWKSYKANSASYFQR